MRKVVLAFTVLAIAALAGCASPADPVASAPPASESAPPTVDGIVHIAVNGITSDGEDVDWESEDIAHTGQLHGLLLAQGQFEQNLNLQSDGCASTSGVLTYTTENDEYAIEFDGCADADDPRTNALETLLTELVAEWINEP